MTPLRSRPDFYLLPAITILAVVTAVLLVGWRVIDPTDVSWLRGDPLQSYLGWEFLRDESKWNFPPLWADRLGYPIGVSVAYLDSMPLFAIIFHFFDPLLPQNFQYLGLALVIGIVLQAYFAYSLFSKLFRDDPWFAALAACFLIISPVLLFRAEAHFPLTQQWLIIAAFSCYFDDRICRGSVRYLLPFAVLLFLACGIHPYLLLMVLMVAFAAIARLLCERRTSIRSACAAAAGLGAVGLGSAALFGYLGSGATPAGEGYSKYSMNLLAPIDPQRFGGLLLKGLPIRADQYEGYNYLGLGVIVLLAVGVMRTVARHNRRKIVLKPAILPLAILFAVCLALAVSYRVTVGPWQLFDVPLPQIALRSLSIFHGSGRLFWPAYYLLTIAALVLVRRFVARTWALALITCMLVLQTADVGPLRSHVRAGLSEPVATPLRASDWSSLGEGHAHLVVVPAWQCDSQATPGGDGGFGYFGLLAIEQHMTINSYYSARPTDEARAYFCDEVPKQLLSSGLEENTAYVLSPGFFARLVAAGRTPTHQFCRVVDGFVLCAKDSRRVGFEDGLLQSAFPAVGLDQDLLFGPEAAKGLILDEGWSWGESWGRWTDGKEAELSFRVTEPPSVPLVVAMRVRAFAPSPRRPRRVRIVINGTRVAEWTFESERDDVRTVPIPVSSIKPHGIITVHFELPDALRPINLGVLGDLRLLGLGAVSLRLLAQ